jgi:hypothetical protein
VDIGVSGKLTHLTGLLVFGGETSGKRLKQFLAVLGIAGWIGKLDLAIVS